MLLLFEILLLSTGIGLALLVGYLLLLTAAAFARPSRPVADIDRPPHRFLVLIPAHNEELLLSRTLTSLKEMDYPAAAYEVHVVADNCQDRTAEVGRNHGAFVHERFDEQLRGKGHALQWLLRRLWADGKPHDAAVFVDADTEVSPNFLQVMDHQLAAGEEAIQAYYAVRDPDRSWSVSLRYVALAVLHYLRPSGRMVLGGSAGLKGNGMVLTQALLRRHAWSGSITEDIEMHMDLLLDGVRVAFAPAAEVRAEMPATLAAATSQNERWETGRLSMARSYIPPLLRAAFAPSTARRHRFALLDAVMEHLIPPFSILVGGTLVVLAAALLTWLAADSRLAAAAGLLAGGALLGEIIYLLAGLRLVRAPGKIYRALLMAPLFMAWKFWLYARVWFVRNEQDWVRTARNES